jgi:hypothetical protein
LLDSAATIRDIPVSLETAMRKRGTATCTLLLFLAVTVVACEQPERHGDEAAAIPAASGPNPQHDVYFVETHLHADASVAEPSPDWFARIERHVHAAYAQGLLAQAREGSDRYEFGVVGGSDNPHWGASGFDDHVATAAETGGPGEGSTPSPRSVTSAAALGGVWAEQDTRESMVEAMTRRETFATSGTRIQLRFFAGWSYADDLVDQDRWVARAYERGVPMGGELSPSPAERAPTFVVWAVRDPDSAPLERLQIVKVWVEDGAAREAVHDVACSDGGAPDATTGRCPDNGASVDLADCSFSTDRGDGELGTVWTDPAFDPSRHAFYYARVLENPTCCRSTRDAMRRGVAPPADARRTIQERALSSPIWYTPTEARR